MQIASASEQLGKDLRVTVCLSVIGKIRLLVIVVRMLKKKKVFSPLVIVKKKNAGCYTAMW